MAFGRSAFFSVQACGHHRIRPHIEPLEELPGNEWRMGWLGRASWWKMRQEPEQDASSSGVQEVPIDDERAGGGDRRS